MIDLQALESPDKLYLSNPKQLGSRPDSPPLDEPNTQETGVKDDLGLYTVETEIGKRVSFEWPSSSNPSVEEVEQVELRKRSRVSIISNISNRFRKSMDLDSSTKDDAMRLVRERSSSSSESQSTATYLMEDQLVANPTGMWECYIGSQGLMYCDYDCIKSKNSFLAPSLPTVLTFLKSVFP